MRAAEAEVTEDESEAIRQQAMIGFENMSALFPRTRPAAHLGIEEVRGV